MHNQTLGDDYIWRAQKRLKALEVLFESEAWADVVREAQEIVELALKGLLRKAHIEVPRIHDVSDIVCDNLERLPQLSKQDAEKMAQISRSLRRDRELSFYGSEDLTPSEFYKKPDAEAAKQQAAWVLMQVISVATNK